MSGFHYQPPEASLRATLTACNAERLKRLLLLLPGVKLKAPRKAEVIETLERYLLGPGIESLWKQLNPLQQMAVQETVHARDRYFEADGFKAKHGTLPEFTRKSDKSSYYQDDPTLLQLFIPSSIGSFRSAPFIPDDLQKRLLEFVPEPPQTELATLDALPELPVRQRKETVATKADGNLGLKTNVHEAPLVQRHSEPAAIQDLRTVLRLVEQEKLSASAKTRRPSKATIKTLAALLCDGDFYEITEPTNKWVQVIGPIKCFAWPLLLQAGNLAKAGTGPMKLTKRGRAALEAPPEQTLKELWMRWLGTKVLDEFNRIDTIKGQTGRARRGFTAPADRRSTIEAALSRCPLGRWVEFDEFSRYMRADGFRFNVHNEPYRLYIAEAQYGHLGYNGSGGWNILQDRYLLCLLFEYAASLGIIDVAYEHPGGARTDFYDHWGTDDLAFLSRYDGLKYFRLTPLGAFILEVTESWTAPTAKPSSSITVLPNRSIRLTHGSLAPDEVILLETYADPVDDGSWTINEAKTLTAVEKGARLKAFRTFLQERDPQPLPQTVEGFLSDIERRASACICAGTGLLIECHSEETADIIAGNPRTRPLCQRTGSQGLVVPIDKEKAFRTALNSIGYGMPLI